MKPVWYLVEKQVLTALIAYRIVYSNGMTRDELAEHLNVPRTTLYDNLVRLEKKQLVKRVKEERPGKGRFKVRWTLITTFK